MGLFGRKSKSKSKSKGKKMITARSSSEEVHDKYASASISASESAFGTSGDASYSDGASASEDPSARPYFGEEKDFVKTSLTSDTRGTSSQRSELKTKSIDDVSSRSSRFSSTSSAATPKATGASSLALVKGSSPATPKETSASKLVKASPATPKETGASALVTDSSSLSLSTVTMKEQEELQASGPDRELNVDYDANPTLLYKFIEYKDWDEALQRCAVAPEEARTWVIRYEDYNDSDEITEASDYESKVIRWQMLPIHVAIVFNAPVKLVTAILHAYPIAIKKPDDRKMLPIHLSCRNLTNLNVAQFLVIKDTDTLTMTDYKGRTPLVILKEYREKNTERNDKESKVELKNRDVLIKMIMNKLGMKAPIREGSDSDSEYSAGESTYNSDSETDDESLENRSTQDSSVISRNKSGDSTFSDNGQDLVVEQDSEDTAKSKSSILKNRSAKSSAQKSVQNAYNKHADVSSKSSKVDSTAKDYSVIPKERARKNYIQRNKKAIKPANEVDYDTKPSVLIKLIEKKMWTQAITRCADYPEEASTWMCRLQEVKTAGATKKEVRWKILPIHSAIVLHSPVELIESLVDAYPQGLRKGDDRDMLPLHMAFRLGASPETTAVLVDAYPDALKKRDSKGHTPLHILKAYRRKYQKESASGSKKSKGTFMDKNRRQLIRFYLGGRKYGEDDDATLAPFDSDNEDESEGSADSTILFENDNEDDEYDQLFYKNMFNDFSSLAAKGLSTIPNMVRDTLACRT